MTKKGLNKLIFDVEEELNWHRITFTCMVYPGESFENAHEKIGHSLTHFPYQIHTHEMVRKERTGVWGNYIKQTVDIGLLEGVTLEDVYKKFNNVTHLQQYELTEDQPANNEKTLVKS